MVKAHFTQLTRVLRVFTFVKMSNQRVQENEHWHHSPSSTAKEGDVELFPSELTHDNWSLPSAIVVYFLFSSLFPVLLQVFASLYLLSTCMYGAYSLSR